MDNPNFYQKFLSDLSLQSLPIYQIKDIEFSGLSVLVSILIMTLTVYGARWVSRVVSKHLSRGHVNSGVRDSVTKFVRYGILVLGALLSLDNLGVSFSSLTTISAILMVGIGFGLQNLAQNFIAGIILLIERPIKVGDIIRIGDTTGRVVDIRVRSSIILTRDDVTIIVPNSKFISEEVTNETLATGKKRQHVKVNVAYGSDINLVKKMLIEAALEHPEVVREPSPMALIQDFGDSSIEFDLRFWCRNIWRIESITSDIRTRIDKKFREHQIGFGTPRLDVLFIENKIASQAPKKSDPDISLE